MWPITLVIALSFVGCAMDPAAALDATAEDAGTTSDGSISVLDSQVGDATADAVPPDAQVLPTPGDCHLALLDTPLDIDPGGSNTQIHPAIVGDGQSIWIAYNKVASGASTFDIWVTRLACDGTPLLPPTLISDTPNDNDTDPSIAVSGNGVLVAWARSTEGADPNLSIHTRRLSPEGQIEGPVRRFGGTREGSPFAGGQWMAHVAATSTGWVLTGSRGVESRSAFQLFAQRLDAAGDTEGPSVSAEVDDIQQLESDVAVDAHDTVWITWNEGQGDGRVMWASWRADSDELTVTPAIVAPAGSGRLAVGEMGAVVVGHREQRQGVDVRVTFSAFDDVAPRLLGNADTVDFNPAVALDGDTAVVAWFRRLQGNQSSVWFQTIDAVAGDLVGLPRSLPLDVPAAPYPMAITRVTPGLFALLWSEIDDGTYRIKAQFIRPQP